VNNASVYRAHRIHPTRYLSGLWASVIVSIGIRQPTTKDSLTDTATRVPGEYDSEVGAIQAAMRYIDDQETHP